MSSTLLPPHANSFVIGPAVIKHTHNALFQKFVSCLRLYRLLNTRSYSNKHLFSIMIVHTSPGPALGGLQITPGPMVPSQWDQIPNQSQAGGWVPTVAGCRLGGILWTWSVGWRAMCGRGVTPHQHWRWRVGRIEHHDRCLWMLVLVYFAHQMGCVWQSMSSSSLRGQLLSGGWGSSLHSGIEFGRSRTQ